MDQPVSEGSAPYDILSTGDKSETYYKIIGQLHNGRAPIVIVHGGPGSGHNYLLAFSKLWDCYGLTVIFYDQIGIGRSTHFRHKVGDHTFWTMELLVQELENLVAHLGLADPSRPGYHILGHSVGGMISSSFATRQPQGLRKLVLANAPGSVDLHLYGMELWWKEMGGETQLGFEEAMRTRKFKAQNYLNALGRLNKLHWCRADSLPEELKQSGKNRADDSTVTDSLWGSSPCDLIGSLKGWSCSSELRKINVPALLYHGEFDIERDEVVAPYIQNIPGIQKVKIRGVSHMPHLESENSQNIVLELVSSFLTRD